MSETDARPGGSRWRTVAVLCQALALGAVAMIGFGFVRGIDAALDGSGTGAGGFVALLLLGVAILVACAVTAIVGIVRSGIHGAWISVLVICALPVVGVVVIAVSNRG